MKALVLASILVAVSFAGCIRLDRKVKGFVGQPRDKLMKEFGPPAREMRLMEGRTVLWFEPRPARSGEDEMTTCREVFHLDRNGIVISASAQNCVGLCLGSHCW